jgi:hypothetical protein
MKFILVVVDNMLFFHFLEKQKYSNDSFIVFVYWSLKSSQLLNFMHVYVIELQTLLLWFSREILVINRHTLDVNFRKKMKLVSFYIHLAI